MLSPLSRQPLGILNPIAMAGHGHGTLDDQRYELSTAISNSSHIDELVQAKAEIELLKRAVSVCAGIYASMQLNLGFKDPFNVVEMAIEVQTERMRVTEMMNARDAAVQRLSDAYESLRQKTATIEHMTKERDCQLPLKTTYGSDHLEIERLRAEIASLEVVIKDLRDEIKALKDTAPITVKPPDPPPQYNESYLKVSYFIFHTLQLNLFRTISNN